MVATITFTAAKSGVVHDGKSMIVNEKGKKTKAAASSEEFLRKKGFIKGKVALDESSVDAEDGGLSAAIERAEAAEARLAELEAGSEGGDTFELEGYSLNNKGGGWYEITGPDGFETVKEQGEANAKGLFAQLVADKLNPPAAEDAAPAS